MLSDADGDLQVRFQAFLDFNNPKLERSRANFDQSHMIKSFGNVELPFGKGYRMSYRPLDRLHRRLAARPERWCGSPARRSRSPPAAAHSTARRGRITTPPIPTLNKSQLGDIVKFQMTGIGPAIIAESAINPTDFTGVNADGEPRFAGQVFSNPGPRTVGSLQRRLLLRPVDVHLNARL